MKRRPVYLTVEQRRRAVEEFAWSLRKWNIEVLVISIDRVHFHVLARFPDHNPRRWVGLAKKESSAYMKQDGLAPQGGLWAVRFQCLPVHDRAHQIEVFGYICDHSHAGAIVWRFDRA
jgi:hypothetical protein